MTAASRVLTFNGVSFDTETGELGGAIDGRCRLPKYVMTIMEALMSANGRICSRDRLVDAMWRGRDDGPEAKGLDVVIHRLRRDLAAIKAPIFVVNEWGRGFRVAATMSSDMRIRCPRCGELLDGSPLRKRA